MGSNTTSGLLLFAILLPVLVGVMMEGSTGSMRAYNGLVTVVWGVGAFCVFALAFAAGTTILLALIPSVLVSFGVMACSIKRDRERGSE